MGKTSGGRAILPAQSLQTLIDVVHSQGYRLIGPTLEDNAIVYDDLENVENLPLGISDRQSPGNYRLEDDPSAGYFAHVVGPHSWKRFLFPAAQKLWSATRVDQGFSIQTPEDETKLAFIGVRACEIKALQMQDRVFSQGPFTDNGYGEKRQNCLIIAVNCSRAADTCFCSSMDAGPRVTEGFDLALTELQQGRHDFLIETGSANGEALLKELVTRKAEDQDFAEADAQLAATEASIQRRMPSNIPEVLERHLQDEHWQTIESRCLNCSNCTLVCPTCFCSTVEDTTDLTGQHAERWRYWDSCFNTDFSYIHGGSIRQSGAARYRQWITHKLSYWHKQFGTSGCTGCGRCITWCPVGIDITEEAATFCEIDKRS
ncbi:MAG: sulfite reductase subunit A [Sedimenticola sp.]|nr:MAG: sulfite reductase subunit A [Sedimenticola sp.]